MKTSTSILKKRSKQKLKGKYGLCIGSQFLVGAIMCVLLLVYFLSIFFTTMMADTFFYRSMASSTMDILLLVIVGLFSLGILVLTALLTPGILKIYLNIGSGQNAGLSNLLFAFNNRPFKFIGYFLLFSLIELIWAIPYFVVLTVGEITDFIPVMIVLLVLMYLFMLIGIVITSLYLAQSLFLLIDFPEMGVIQSLKESVNMMKGNKGGFFYLLLSFTGMVLLGYLSYGIGLLWVLPYMYMTMTEYYLDLKEKYYVKTDHSFEDASDYYDWNTENKEVDYLN